MTLLEHGPVTRHIDSVVEHLFAPLLGPRKSGSRWEVVNWDAEQGLCLTVRHEDAYLLFEFEQRDDTRDAYARTDRFNVHVRRNFEAGVALTPANRKLVDRIIEVVRRREGLLPDMERSSSARRSMLREIVVDRLLMPEGKGQYYINPYVGCMIGCDFCYVIDRADFSRRLEGLPHLRWGAYVDVKVNAAEVLAEEVKHVPPGPVRFSPILTDPYQGPERRFRITRQCLEVLLPAGFTPVVLTRAARVMEDADLLGRFERAAVGLSIPTDDDRIRRIFEPGGDPLDQRFEALAALRQRGVLTFAVIQPVLPMDPQRLVDRLAPLIDSVRVDRMHFVDKVDHLYRDNDLMYATTDEFFEETRRALIDPLRDRGVGVDEMDDLAALISDA